MNVWVVNELICMVQPKRHERTGMNLARALDGTIPNTSPQVYFIRSRPGFLCDENNDRQEFCRSGLPNCMNHWMLLKLCSFRFEQAKFSYLKVDISGWWLAVDQTRIRFPRTWIHSTRKSFWKLWTWLPTVLSIWRWPMRFFLRTRGILHLIFKKSSRILRQSLYESPGIRNWRQFLFFDCGWK